MNEDFEDIQRLIRLKKHESPGEGYTDDFLTRFQRRQREEMLRKSSIDLFFERISTRFEDLMTPKWTLAGAIAAVCVLSAWMYNMTPTGGAALATQKQEMTSPSDESQPNTFQNNSGQTAHDRKALPAKGSEGVAPQKATHAIGDGKEGILGH